MSKATYPSTTFVLVLLTCLAWGSAAAQQFSVWSAPVNLGPSINTEISEFHSAISADALTLFFPRTAQEALGLTIFGLPSAAIETPIGSPRKI